jgi:hypothetical protein
MPSAPDSQMSARVALQRVNRWGDSCLNQRRWLQATSAASSQPTVKSTFLALELVVVMAIVSTVP